MALTLFCTANATAQCSVVYIGQDIITGGDWDGVTDPLNPVGSPIGVYGSYAHILPGACGIDLEYPLGPFEVPLGEYEPEELPGLLMDDPFFWTEAQVNGLLCYAPDPPYNDEYQSLNPPVTYLVRGTVVGPTGEPFPLDYIQHPAFTWAWEDWQASQGADPRRVYYRTLGLPDHWILACWDDGGERCFPENGYIDFELYFPEGMYLLSLYAYDKEADGSRVSQEYQIFDLAMTPLLASEQISGTDYTGGIYKIYRIEAGAGGCTIIVRVNNDEGHDPLTGFQVNILLSGIFVDKLSVPGHTIGFWKNNVDKNIDGENAKGKDKNGNAQLTQGEMIALLDGILLSPTEFCPEVVAAFVGLSLEEASAILNNHKGPILQKADAQVLALLLSVGYYSGMDSDYLLSPIYLPDVGQAGGAFLGILSDAVGLILSEYCAGNYDVAHELATILNEME